MYLYFNYGNVMTMVVTLICTICKHVMVRDKIFKLLRSYKCNYSFTPISLIYNNLCHKNRLTMPKKKKSKLKMPKTIGFQDGHIFCNSGAVVEGAPITTLNYLIEIFKNKLDEDVVKLVVDECDFNVDQAFETLTSLCNDESLEGCDKIPSHHKLENNAENFSDIVTPSSSTVNPFPDSISQSKSFKDINTEIDITNPIKNDRKEMQDDYNQNNYYFPCTTIAPSSTLPCQALTSIISEPWSTSSDVPHASESSGLNLYPNSQSFETVKPNFFVPSIPIPGKPSFLKPAGMEKNMTLWNMSDSKHFSTSPRKYQYMKNKDNPTIKEITERIQLNHRLLVILRGLPGSGKSSLARKLKYSGEVFSTDDFFISNGHYLFDPYRLSEAHEWNKLRTKKALEKGITPVIIDNTNVEKWEMKPYVIMGKKYKYEIVILEPDTPWKFSVNELARKNKHGVPKSKLSKMKENYDHNVSVEKILGCKDFPPKNIFSSAEKVASCKQIDSSDNNEFNLMRDNNVSLRAIIHSEDNSVIDPSLLLDNSSQVLVEKEFNIFDDEAVIEVKKMELDTTDTTGENPTSSHSTLICNLDQLRMLARNDSEDSQSCSSINGSSQEISGWEAITELDNDFRWTASSEKVALNANQICKSRSADNLNLKEPSVSIHSIARSYCTNESISSSSGDISTDSLEHLYELVQNSDLNKKKELEKNKTISEMATIANSKSENLDPMVEYCDLSSLNIKKNVDEKVFLAAKNKNDNSKLSSEYEEHVATENITDHLDALDLITVTESTWEPSSEHLATSDETTQSCRNENQNVPKPPRNNIQNVLTIGKNTYIKQMFHKSETFESCSDWTAEFNQADESITDNTLKDTSTPKPQRPEFQDRCCKKINKKQPNKSNLTKSILNISLDSIDADWTFPPYIQADNCVDNKSVVKKPLTFKMSVSSQTEPRDFDFMYKISSSKDTVNTSNYNIINARPCNDIPVETDVAKLSDDLEIDCSQQILTFDKSTSTNDMVDTVEVSQKLTHLRKCFPDISQDDLLHLLEMCCNDEKWVSNLLLDWGYKYNVPSENSYQGKEKVDLENGPFGLKNLVELFRYKSRSSSQGENSSGASSDSDNFSSSSVEEPFEFASANEAIQELHLVLDPVFAYQLEELFGPVSSSGKRQVVIDLELAKLIHEKWKNSVQASEKEVKEDKDVTVKKIRHKHKNKRIRASEPIKFNKEPSSFLEIMDMELAIQLHKEQKLKKDDDFATKMKRLELYNMFPGADTIALDEIFDNNNYCLQNCLSALGEDLSQTETIQKKKNAEKMDTCINEWGKSNIFQEFENGDWSDWVFKDDSTRSVHETAASAETYKISDKATELRDTAAKHYQLRDEFIQKAQAAYCRGMKDVASFYAQQGAKEGRIAKNTNKLASTLIAQEKNALNSPSELDLHGLHISEAITLLEKFLRTKKIDMKKKQLAYPCIVSVITGQGIHSVQGAKLRPAVLNYLKKFGYYFSEIKTGQIDVTVLPD